LPLAAGTCAAHSDHGAIPARRELGVPDRDLRRAHLDGLLVLVSLPGHRSPAAVLTYLGIMLGIGLEVKYTILGLVVGKLMAISRVKRPKLSFSLHIAVVVAALVEFLVFAQITLPITPPDRLHAAGLDAKTSSSP